MINFKICDLVVNENTKVRDLFAILIDKDPYEQGTEYVLLVADDSISDSDNIKFLCFGESSNYMFSSYSLLGNSTINSVEDRFGSKVVKYWTDSCDFMKDINITFGINCPIKLL